MYFQCFVESVIQHLISLKLILVFFVFFLSGYLHLFSGEVQASQVQQNLHLPGLGLRFGLVPGTVLRSLGSSVDHLQNGSNERDSVAGMY